MKSEYTIHYEKYAGQGLGVRAYIGWYDKVEREVGKLMGNVMYVHRSADGCYQIFCEKGYFYPQEFEAVLKAANKLKRDYESEKKASFENWLAKTANVHSYDGVKFDLSRTEVQKILKNRSKVNKEGRPCVWYKGKWHALFRTDLKDDIGTYGETMEEYCEKAKTCFGARVRDGRIGIIDVWSDG